VVATVALPFTPLASLLGLVALGWRYLLAVAGIVGLYILASEVSKAFVFRHLADAASAQAGAVGRDPGAISPRRVADG